ncbi:hypothetical protein AB0M43_30520 [Longispora sp. NPDC051575]|uniref:hypothetical protein n=1 Tax=Longispora sp. NPDC051575 TaxID=3154943 RepID=UPI003413A36A
MADLNPDHEQDVPVPSALFGFRDTAPGAFVAPPVASVVAAGARRRQRRTVVAAAALSLVVLGGVGGVVNAARSGPDQLPTGVTPSPVAPTPFPTPSRGPSVPPTLTPTVTPTTKPSSVPPSASTRPPLTVVPPAAMLALTDLETGYRVAPEDAPGTGDWMMSYWTQYCAAASTLPATAGISRRDRSFLKGEGETADAVYQRVELEPLASQQLEHWRQWATRCAKRGTLTVTILDSGFAGDGSLMVKVSNLDGGVEYGGTYVLVRVGDLITEIAGRHSGERDVAVKAAQRLCAIAGSC